MASDCDRRVRVALELFDVFRRGEAGDPLELTVEIGNVVVAALVTDLCDREFSSQEQFAGVADAQFADILECGFSGFLLEIAAEGAGVHSGGLSDFVEAYFAGVFTVEFPQYLIYSGLAVSGEFEIDAVVVEPSFVGCTAHHGENVDTGEQPIKSFFLRELLNVLTNWGIGGCVETDSVTGHMEQLLDFHEFRVVEDCVVEEILGKLDGDGVYAQVGIVLIIGVVVAVHMWQETSEEYQVTVGEGFYVVPREAGSGTFDDVDDFVFVVEMPGVLEVVVVASFDFDRGTAGQSHLFVHDVDFVFHRR